MESLQPHIQLGKDLQIKYALMPGDPARLDRIAPFLENVTELKFNREYRSLSGTYKGVPILAISTLAAHPQALLWKNCITSA